MNLVTPEELLELRRDALPVTVYLKERLRNREDRRRVLVPFSIRLRDLKLEECRANGTTPRYVGQLDRPQILYMKADRPLMDRAFAQTVAVTATPDIRSYFRF